MSKVNTGLGATILERAGGSGKATTTTTTTAFPDIPASMCKGCLHEKQAAVLMRPIRKTCTEITATGNSLARNNNIASEGNAHH